MESIDLLRRVYYPPWVLAEENEEKTKKWREDEKKILSAINMIICHGGHDGESHKEWCLDQVFMILTGSEYDRIIKNIRDEGYRWNHGIAP